MGLVGEVSGMLVCPVHRVDEQKLHFPGWAQAGKGKTGLCLLWLENSSDRTSAAQRREAAQGTIYVCVCLCSYARIYVCVHTR